MKSNIDVNTLIEERKYIKSCFDKYSNISLCEYIVYDTDLLLKESYENMEYVGETLERKTKDILKKYDFNIKYLNFYAYIMREVTRNVIEHSKSKEMILLLYYDKKNEFGFKVIDMGIGIKKSLNSNPNYKIADDKTAIAFAVRPGITRSWKRDPFRDEVWQNSGFGLYMVSNIINNIKGRFEISSGNSGLEYRDGFSNFLDKKIKGTEITVVFDKTKEFNTIKIINRISSEGSKILKESGNSYAKYAEVDTASKASTLINS